MKQLRIPTSLIFAIVFSIQLSGQSTHSSPGADSIKILLSIDEKFVNIISFKSSMDFDSTFLFKNDSVLVSWNLICESNLCVCFGGREYYLTLPPDLSYYSHTINVKMTSVKNSGKRYKVFFYSAQAGQLSMARHGVTAKLYKIRSSRLNASRYNTVGV